MAKCTYSADGNTIDLVTDDMANEDLSGMVKTEAEGMTPTAGISGTNAHAEFELHVFQLGRGESGTFSCDMKLVSVWRSKNDFNDLLLVSTFLFTLNDPW